MDKIPIDELKIKEYAKIQANLCALKPNSDDESIDQLIKEIPPSFLSSKEDLMIICELFTQYARNYVWNIRGNVIKLLERILVPIKTHLQNESFFFWTIFGGLFYFKRWFYNEGLISFDEILFSSIKDDSSLAKEYFLPEIIEKAPEIFENQIKFQITCPYTKEYLDEFKELRSKHFQWLRNSSDCCDPSYKEIEKNPLRLSIKTDDVDSFQKILSNTGMSINSMIQESTLENFHKFSEEFPLIEYAISFNSINIIKFLIMNNCEMKDGIDFSAVLTHDNEIIHLVESKMKSEFEKFIFVDSIGSWNDDVVEYSIENYGFDFLEKSDIGSEYDGKILMIFNQTVLSKNFIFFENYMLPFLKKNSMLVNRNINNLVMRTFSEYTCFFMKAFLKHPDIDINFVSEDDDNHTFLSKSVYSKNTISAEIFVKYSKLVNKWGFMGYTPFQLCCLAFPNARIMKLIANNPDFDINSYDKNYGLTAFDLAVGRGNFIAIELIINNFKDFKSCSFYLLFFRCLVSNSLYSLKIILKYFLEKKKTKCKSIVKTLKKKFHTFEDYKDEFLDTFSKIIYELAGVNDDNKEEEEEEDDMEKDEI